jgi:beta-lactamase regulating signal transducer with metallopeptidase domain
MKLMEALLGQPLMETLGWTLMHFVWQGALVALLLGAALFLLRRGDPRKRYAVLCAGMLALVAAPVVTGVVTGVVIHSPAVSALPAVLEAGVPEAASIAEETVVSIVPISTGPGWTGAIEAFLPHLLLVWFGGVCLFSARLIGGWLYLVRLKERAQRLGRIWQETGERLCAQLDLGRRVRLLESSRIEVPMVIGWLRPAVLMPVGALTGLTPGQVEAILLHELAHIRRYDSLVNALQAVAETLFFYHPVVWWVSHRMRVEREYCCDDMVVEVGEDTLGYARALSRLEEMRGTGGVLAVAAGGGSLLGRIRRLVVPGMQVSSGAGGFAGSAVLALALVVGVLAGVYPGHSVTADGGRHGMEENVEMPLQVGEKMVVVRMFEDGGMAAVDSVMENGEERRTEVRFEALEEKLGEWRKEKRDTRLLIVRAEPEVGQGRIGRVLEIARRVGLTDHVVNWGTSPEVQTEPPFAFQVELEERGQVAIEIKGPRGRVHGLVYKEEEAGSHEYTWDGRWWDGSEAESGEYIANVHAGRLFRKHRLILKWPERVFLSVLKGKLWLRDGRELKEITVEGLRDYVEGRKRENSGRDVAIWFRGAEEDRLVAEIERIGREVGVRVVRPYSKSNIYS